MVSLNCLLAPFYRNINANGFAPSPKVKLIDTFLIFLPNGAKFFNAKLGKAQVGPNYKH